jgi:hypothetical protein
MSFSILDGDVCILGKSILLVVDGTAVGLIGGKMEVG